MIQTRRILIADDEEEIRHLISRVLVGAGFEVNVAANGEQAWNDLHHEHYDLLVTDDEMPQLKGITLVERIRREGLSLPVIIASGSFSVDWGQTTPELHIAAVLPKPFDLFKLLDIIRSTLRSADEQDHGDRETLPERNPSLRPTR